MTKARSKIRTSVSRTHWLTLLVLGTLAALAFALSACGGGGNGNGSGEAAASPNAESGSQPSSKTEGDSSMGGMKDEGTGAEAGTVVQVKLDEFHVILPSTTLKAGTYTFQAENVGKVEHMLMVEEAPVVMEAPNQPSEEEGVAMGDTGGFQPGETKSLTVTLKPGDYVFFCNVPGHYAAGQHIAVTVTS